MYDVKFTRHQNGEEMHENTAEAELSTGREEVLAWFDRYDRLVAAGDLDAMADMAAFPLNEVTDDADGFGIAGSCDRQKFLRQMREVVGGGADVTMQSTRQPTFLSPALCFVVTDTTFTVDGHEQQMRYGDLLMRTPEGWRFQTMVAGGWHGQM
ncbi:DUF4440 domain-containing protein [Nocardioides sp.]|uniref:DUF4440 domain-containing protein n=1 Tax=Nocardioides sp. TaxID=35761 RepID=UPI002734160F|nr:DUF4440 domain-containing protein [Nocardioides sp.]MDP3889763.1 DUF4440 domain-containing protein [Nocardioides sp.]